MARSRTVVIGDGGITRLAGLRHYLVRRSALELAVLDGFVLVAGLWITLPGPASLDPFWTRVLLALSPGLMLVARSLVITLQVPGAFALAQLDPSAEPPPHPLLDEARHLTWLGMGLLLVTVAGAAALAGIWRLGSSF